MSCILPCLINDGLLSEVQDVRFLSLGMQNVKEMLTHSHAEVIVDISEKAGDAIKPHVTTVIMTMLEGLSGLENPALNYLGNRLSEQGQVI